MLRKRDVFLVQIGANDGITIDPLYKFVTEYAWRGVLLDLLCQTCLRTSQEKLPTQRSVEIPKCSYIE